ncbi:MAG: helicase [Circoviridae sp.]|nr:MAG: helicase [Circoviridae sp.]
MKILTGDLNELLMDGTLAALQLPNAIKARAAFKLLKLPEDQPGVRGIWVYGPPNTGKSHYVRHLEPELYLKAQNKWWDGYLGEPAVLIDDFDKKGEHLSHNLKLWADKWSCTGEIKGATIPLNFQRLYVTSNYRPDEIFDSADDDLLAAIQRRFKMKYLGEPYVDPRP